MAKVVTVRLSDEEYRKIASSAKVERRPLSNFITMIVLKGIEEGRVARGRDQVLHILVWGTQKVHLVGSRVHLYVIFWDDSSFNEELV